MRFTFQIDDIAPTVKMSILGIADTNQSVVLQIESSDVGSGVARTSIYEVTGLLIVTRSLLPFSI